MFSAKYKILATSVRAGYVFRSTPLLWNNGRRDTAAIFEDSRLNPPMIERRDDEYLLANAGQTLPAN